MTSTNDHHDERFPLVLYQHGNGELMMPATHVTALLRHVAETVRMWRVRGEVPLDLMTTARIYDSVVNYAADLDTAIAAADTSGLLGQGADRAAADELARDLAELTAGYLADGEPVAPGLPGPPAAHRDPGSVV
ncbi:MULTISPECIES: hypothetical protein [Streptomycetaceae]|uniref:hypothetical protein n=1 Tax=Streptomycetaceae TaxID=2062 RepID=UPI00093E04AA|nr:hypothetical protein [Streptomyces sp. CB02056]OKH97501.1 hypothetical protein AMK13_37915 [Streptomyces sp. CB02056]